MALRENATYFRYTLGPANLGTRAYESGMDGQFGTAIFRRPWSLAYICPICGELWGRRAAVGNQVRGKDEEWLPIRRYCSPCANLCSSTRAQAYGIPGSLTDDEDAIEARSSEGMVLEDVPYDLLKHEVLMDLNLTVKIMSAEKLWT